MQPDEPRPSRIKPVPRVTWRSHLGCGALLGFVAGFLAALRAFPEGLLKPLLIGLAAALVVGLVAALLGHRFWFRL